MENQEVETRFNPENSKTMRYLMSLSEKELYKRYYTSQPIPDLKKRFEYLINLRDKEDKSIYLYLAALGSSLIYFWTRIITDVVPLVGNNCDHLNIDQIVSDLNNILGENRLEIFNAQNGVTKYMQDIEREFLVNIVGKSIVRSNLNEL